MTDHSSGPAWRQSRMKRLQVWMIAAVATPLLRLLIATWRIRVEGDEALAALAAARQHGIFAFWHGRILQGIACFRDRGIVVITSENFDGEWIARIITRFGFGTARGSSSRGGRKALLQLVRDARMHSTAFTVDGPRGPARQAQPGAVWLSKATGHPVVPFHAEASSVWTLSSWDRTQIPKPFATVVLVIGPPFQVPGDVDEEGLERARQRLETSLADCEARCRALLPSTPV
ncbi:MAG: DUF374 domain-containing protein [Acidobacteria bacterium]|nr:DUF374 domain-containing protein [Acidobacteriota bacterium]